MDTTPQQFFKSLYGALEHPEQYDYELRYLKPGDKPVTQFVPYAKLLKFMALPLAVSARAYNEQGYNLYFGINPRREKRGDKKHIGAAVALYADIDVKDFLEGENHKTGNLEAILRNKPEVLTFLKSKGHALNLSPSIVVDSGRGYQLYWLLKTPVLAQEGSDWWQAIEARNAVLAQIFRGDNVGNIDRIFRFPAFQNRKPVHKGSDHLATLQVSILFCDPSRRYALEDFPLEPLPLSGSLPLAKQAKGTLDDQDLIAKAKAAKNNAKFTRLWDGDCSGYKSQSEAEFALCNLLAYWTKNDRERIDRLFRQSKLYRSKWDTPFNGTTNGWYTIDKVLAQNAPAHQKPEQPAQMVKLEFWYEKIYNEDKDNERIELKIDYRRFLEFLQTNGFGLLIHDKQVQIVRVSQNIVSQTIEKGNVNLTIKQFTLDFLRVGKEEDVLELMLKQHGTFFSTAFLTSLRPLKLQFYRDTDRRCTLFFCNGFVEILRVKQGVTTTFNPYTALKEAIWDTHIHPRAYHGKYSATPLATDDRQSIFSQFVDLVAMEADGKDNVIADNSEAFKYAYAYLLHDYKDYANARAVICVDNDAGMDANGRRGKSLFCEALKALRRVTVEDGRTLKMDSNQFLFQTLDLDSQILMIDDARPKFDFAQFYPTITGDMAMERKREQRLILSFTDSPKLVITTNHAILGNGDSHVARWYILPFTSYFTAEYTPLDEFKSRLFVEWDDQEWQRFFDFSLTCLESYFQYKTPPVADLTTYNESKLKTSLSAELLEYFDEHLVTLPYETPKKTFFQEFKAEYPIYERATQNWFSGKLREYCKHRKILTNPGYEAGRCWKTDVVGVKTEYFVFVKEEVKPNE